MPKRSACSCPWLCRTVRLLEQPGRRVRDVDRDAFQIRIIGRRPFGDQDVIRIGLEARCNLLPLLDQIYTV